LVGGGGGSHGKRHAAGNMVARTILESCKRVQRKAKMAVC
jgi:hypothetical protein